MEGTPAAERAVGSGPTRRVQGTALLIRPIRAAVTAAVVCILVVITGCDGDDGDPNASRPTPSVSAPSGAPTFDFATAILEGEGDPVLLTVEVADTTEQHQFGLMGRESLPEDSGMAFIFFDDQTGGFWMKNTLIPLSIAYFDIDGTIVRILDMEPCKADPCKIYDPEATYRGALEVNQGAFDEWGITEGDLITIRR
jgi:uncharacterized membrane protein (UPF0127 family)